MSPYAEPTFAAGGAVARCVLVLYHANAIIAMTATPPTTEPATIPPMGREGEGWGEGGARVVDEVVVGTVDELEDYSVSDGVIKGPNILETRCPEDTWNGRRCRRICQSGERNNMPKIRMQGGFRGFLRADTWGTRNLDNKNGKKARLTNVNVCPGVRIVTINCGYVNVSYIWLEIALATPVTAASGV